MCHEDLSDRKDNKAEVRRNGRSGHCRRRGHRKFTNLGEELSILKYRPEKDDGTKGSQ